MSRHNRRQNRSRSRSRSPKIHHKTDKSRQHYKNRSRNREDSPKNRKKHYSSSSSDSRSRSRSSQSQHSINQVHNKVKEQQSQQQPRYKIQPTKTLKIQNCTNRQAAQRALTDASISAGTSVPDEVQLRQGSIYAKYPSTQVSSVIKQLLKQKININGMQHRINFYPFKRIDLNMSYDWYCDKCDYKNFARRNKCYRCDNDKNINCRFDYNTSTITSTKINKQQNINNCSLMIRGPVIMEIQQEVLLSIFQRICQVKDIRMIKNKMTGQLKDFAFVQFFTPQDTALALKQATAPDFKVRGQKVSVMYSRNKSDDDYAKPLPYQKKQRKKDFGKKQKKDQPIQSYYNRQRQLQIQQQKLRPIITMEELKQKRQQQLRKKAAISVRELTQQQAKRRQAQLMAKQWQKQARLQHNVLYICVLCRRKFKAQQEMKAHEKYSDLHKYNKKQFQLSL